MYVEREVIDIDMIDQFSSSLVTTWAGLGREELVKSLCGYPMDDLIESIERKGFVADFGDAPYHKEPQVVGKHPFIAFKTDHAYKLSYGGHRYAAAKALKLKALDAFAIKPFDPAIKDRLLQFVDSLGNIDNPSSIVQSLALPFDVRYMSRDDSVRIFDSFLENDPLQFVGESVLDVACNLGWFAIEARRRGASSVSAFDVAASLVNKGKELSGILGLPVTFDACDFWDFNWAHRFDYVLASQCVYHFNTAHRCKHASNHTVEETLDTLCNAAKKKLFLFTFVREDNQKSEDLEGYRPSRSEVISDLKGRGFKSVSISAPLPGAKRTVIATR